MKNQYIIIILVILLVIAVGFILVDKYQQKQLTIFQQGMEAGYEQAIVNLIERAVTCQPVSLFVGNNSIDMIAVECLQNGN